MDGRGWFKSSYSTTNGCVEVNMNWIHSSYSSAQGNCVEASMPAETVLVRDSKLGDDSPIVEFDPSRWQELLDSAVADELNWIMFYPLQFNAKERDAFIKAAIDGEFSLPAAV